MSNDNLTNQVSTALLDVENALIFYVEEGISSDKKAQKILDKSWNIVKEKRNYGYGYDDTNSIAIVWEIDDIRNLRPDLTDDECMEVLDYTDRKHDA